MEIVPLTISWRLAVVLASLAFVTACASARGYTAIREKGVLVEERWEFLSTFDQQSDGDLDPRARALELSNVFGVLLGPPRGCVLMIRGTRISWRPREGRSGDCPLLSRDIDGRDVTRLGYKRASVELLFSLWTSRQTRHFVSIEFRDASGPATTTRFYSEGGNVDALLRSLNRVSGVAITTAAEDARRLPDGIAVAESADPLDLVLPEVPRWEERRLPVSGDTSDFVPGLDGRVVVAGGALWEVSSGRRLAPLPEPRDPTLVAFSPDGRHVVLGHNDTEAKPDHLQRAGTVTIVDAASPTSQVSVTGLPWIDRFAFSPDGSRAFVFHQSPQADPRRPSAFRTGQAVTAVTVDQATIAWQSPLASGHEAGLLSRVDVSPSVVMAVGLDWFQLLDSSTGETVYGPVRVQDLASADTGMIIGAEYFGEVAIVVRVREQSCSVMAVEIASQQTRSADVTCSAPFAVADFSEDRRLLIVSSLARLTILDAETLDIIREVTTQDGEQASPGLSGRDLWSVRTGLFQFDASTGRVALGSNLPEGLERHVVIWDIGTREHPLDRAEPVGQCVFHGRSATLVRGGTALMAAGERELIVCRAPGTGTP